jgi:hypothetical protein
MIPAFLRMFMPGENVSPGIFQLHVAKFCFPEHFKNFWMLKRYPGMDAPLSGTPAGPRMCK